MTAPGQVAPDGAYVIGGGQYKYGQALQEDFVRNLMMGGLRNIRLSNIADAIPLIEGALRKLPLDALRMTKPFLLGTSDADYVDVDTAVATIMRSLKVKEVFLTLGAAQTLIDKLISDIVKIFTGHANGLDALDQWWKDLSGLLGLLTTPDQLLVTLQDLLNKVWTLLTGVINHPDKTLSDVVDALTLWFTNTFDALKNLVTNLGANFQLLLDGLGSIFGLTGAGKTVAEAVQAISDWLTKVFGPVASGLAALVVSVQDLLDGLANLFGLSGVGKSAAEVVTAVGAWLANSFQPLVAGLSSLGTLVHGLLDGLAGVVGATVPQAVAAFTGLVTKLQSFLDGLAGVVGATVPQAVKVITDVVSKLASLIDGLSGVVGGTVAQAVKVVTDVVKTVTDLINGLFSLFGGTGTTINLTTMLAAATSWMTNWQKFVDGIWNAFTGGVAGAGKTVTDALKAVTDWLSNVFQKLLDEIAKLWGWTPGTAAGTIHAGIQNVVDTIAGILGIGQSAASAADHANIGLAAIKAAQKSGFSDEFDYPKSTTLPAPWAQSGSNKWGPSGAGILEYKGVHHLDGPAEEVYKQTRDPIVGPTGTITVVLTKPPWFDAITQSHVGINGRCAAGDKSCLQWWVNGERAQLRVLNAAGTATNQGAQQTIPKLKRGDVLEMSWTATDSTLRVNGIAQATRPYTGTLTGQLVGVTMQTNTYNLFFADKHPAAELAGIAWHA